MTAGEYVSAFASIILALAVTDLAMSMHRLLRARKRVRWDWLVLAVALLILLGTVQYWWTLFAIWNFPGRFSLGGFLPYFVTLLLLFFVACAALPDDVPPEGLDLEDYYFGNRAYFWSLFALLAVSTTVSTMILRAPSATGPLEIVRWVLLGGNVELVVIAGVLIATRRRWVHAALILFMLIAMTWQWVALAIAD